MFILCYQKDFLHPRNKEKKGGILVFSDGKRKVYPDFYDRERKIVLDAKYKKLEFTEKGSTVRTCSS